MEIHQHSPHHTQGAVSCDPNAAFATRERGYRDGQQSRIRGAALTTYTRVGIDDYAQGFRAGYFGRTHLHAEKPAARHAAAHALNPAAPATEKSLLKRAS